MAETLPAPDPASDPKKTPTPGLDTLTIVDILAGYRSEGELARKGGLNPRDQVWADNWDLYWGRYDFSKKAPWQSKLVMPEAQQYVDRWAAAMKEALAGTGEWYEIEDDSDEAGDLKPHIRKFLDWLLSRCGRTVDGHAMDFPAVFEEVMKIGAIAAACGTVTWKQDADGGYVAVETSDPRLVWYDPRGRGLYRFRKIEIDKHELVAMAKAQDAGGKPLYNLDEIQRLAAQSDQDAEADRERSAGHGTTVQASARKPIVLHEYLCTLLNAEGEQVSTGTLAVVANDRFLIRGPEPNPFWHERDWIVFAPMITVPFSVYGRSYMENWSSVARAFIEMTNLILDATYTSALKAFAVCADMLEDPTEIAEGITPNKLFQLAEGASVKDFLKEIDLGQMPAEVVTVWQALKQETREGSLFSEIALGQAPPKGDTTATEVQAVLQQGSSLIRSIAESVEKRWLEPVLQLVWMTGLQHVDFGDPKVRRELGEDTAQMLAARREDFQAHKLGFRVRGISALVERGQALRRLLAFLALIASNEVLLRSFLERFDAGKVLAYLISLHGIDATRMELSPREKQIRSIVAQAAGAVAAATGADNGSASGQGMNGAPARAVENAQRTP